MEELSGEREVTEAPEVTSEPPPLEEPAVSQATEPPPGGLEETTQEPSPTLDRPREPRTRRKKRRTPAVAGGTTQRRHPESTLILSLRRGLPVEGKVEKVIRGGYEVRVGKARGFCPHSLMDLEPGGNPEEHVGCHYPFRVIQIRRGGDDVVLSRRVLLEEERSEEAKAVRATLIEGALMQGRVARTAEFGAFVDLGAGVLGLVHVSELSHSRVSKVSDVVRVGDRVQVKVLKLDEARGRVSLSIRQATGDPWEKAAGDFPVGSVHEGTVLRIFDFGAFIELAPGVEALAASDSFPPSAEGWREGLEPGRRMSWLVSNVERQRRRISLAPASEAGSVSVEAGAKVKGRVQKAEKFGVFVWLAPGQVGLLPAASTGTPRGTDLAQQFPVGKEIEVEVVEVDPDGRRIRLAVPGAAEKAAPSPPKRPPAPPREPVRREEPARRAQKPQRESHKERKKEPAEPQAPAPPSFGTSLGDVLKAAINKNSGGD